MPAENESTEASALISHATTDSPVQEQSETHSSRWTGDAIRTASLAATFLILFAFADVFRYISTVRLIELGVCREHYHVTNPSLIDNDGNIPEHLCKLPGIQQRLAHLRGCLAALEATVGLLLTLPYGLIVDRVGERLIAGINVVGYLLSCAWLLIVFFYWSDFKIWSAVLAPLFRVIGGGSPVLASVIYSIAAKHVPDANRSLCFFFFVAAQLLTEIIAFNVSALLLDHEFLFLPMILNFPLGLLCLVTLFIIRPGQSPSSISTDENEQNEEDGKRSGSLRHSISILSQFLHNRNVLLLLATVPVAKLVNPITELLFQYIPRKFDLSLASASRALSIQAVESLILLIVVLPIFKEVAQTKFHVVSTNVDLYIVQFGFLVMSFGCLFMALSPTLIVFILGLLVFTFGCSTRPALQSVLTDLVSREQIAVLYTVIAVGDGIGSAGGALILNRSLAIAIEWDDKLYLGLPFVIGGVFYIFGFAGSLFPGHRALHLRRNV